METEDILMCPGPNEIADRVIRAMLRSAACPVYDEFQEFYEQTLDMLAQVFQTTNQVIPLPGSGRSGLESAITSVVERDERTLTIANGQFGDLAIRIVNGIGGKGEAFSSPWGAPIDLEAFAEKLASGPYKLVTMVHNETSTGAVWHHFRESADLEGTTRRNGHGWSSLQATAGCVFGGASVLCLARSPHDAPGRRAAKGFCPASVKCCGVPCRCHRLRTPHYCQCRSGVPDGDLRLPPGRHLLYRVLALFSSGSRPGYPAGAR
jgi:hypothetical protein